MSWTAKPALDGDLECYIGKHHYHVTNITTELRSLYMKKGYTIARFCQRSDEQESRVPLYGLPLILDTPVIEYEIIWADVTIISMEEVVTELECKHQGRTPASMERQGYHFDYSRVAWVRDVPIVPKP